MGPVVDSITANSGDSVGVRRAQPSWVELNLRVRSCLVGPSRTILGTPFFGVAGSEAIAQRGSAGRAARIGESLYTLREKQVISDRWGQGDPQPGRHPVTGSGASVDMLGGLD